MARRPASTPSSTTPPSSAARSVGTRTRAINLGGTSVNLKQRDSLVPNLRTSKTEGQSNFVNPGAIILGVGTDIDVTPKLKAFLNLNYIWLAEPAAIKVALQTDRLRNDLGLDASFGFKYRPLLTDNIVISLGMGFLRPRRRLP